MNVCVIGAGSSGIAACQVLKARGIPFQCFEKGSGVGGNWRYGNDNGMSAAYKSLHINTHRDLNTYATLPMPSEYADFPHHTEMQEYFETFVEHFGLAEHIAFRTEVTAVAPSPDGRWEVTTEPGGTRTFDAVLVANGHHWNPKLPDFPGEFDGETTHAHDYRSPEDYEDKDVLVIGFGNSAVDIAVETSRVSRMTYLSVRRGAHVVPKYLRGEPLSKPPEGIAKKLPQRVQLALITRLIKRETGPMENYGLPTPDHKFGHAHPTVSNELLGRIGHGRIRPRPNVERLEGDHVRFVDGTTQHIDRIVYATGYRITFPFLSEDLLPVRENRVSLFKKVVPPDLPGLYFLGLVQPLGALPPIAEAQAEWIADLLQQRAALPSPDEMRASIEEDRRAIEKRYVDSTRHTIQVDFFPYLKEIARERSRNRPVTEGKN
ncbi:MAG: NAD(P)-binding domain-containing protein [Thermoleophilaceae bacterium]|nr:NAD(P)-binding domain-containing protein [Thermoleophilaceae bacterium]